MVAAAMAMHGLSQRRACGLIEITRRSFRHAAAADRNRELRERLKALAEERRRWGCPMLYQVIRREGWRVNHMRIERLHREEGLSLRRGPAAQAAESSAGGEAATGGESNLGGRFRSRQPDERQTVPRPDGNR